MQPSQSSPCIVSCSAPPSTCTEPKVFVKVTTNATFRTGLIWGLPNTIPLKSIAVLQAQRERRLEIAQGKEIWYRHMAYVARTDLC